RGLREGDPRPCRGARPGPAGPERRGRRATGRHPGHRDLDAAAARRARPRRVRPLQGRPPHPGGGEGRARGDPPPPPDRGLPRRGAGDARGPGARGGRGARALHIGGARGVDGGQARRTEPRPAPQGDPAAEKPPPAPPPRDVELTAEPALPGEAAVARAARASLDGRSCGIVRVWPFLGPAFIAAVAYIDPGNFATNISGGAQFGYLLLWVVLGANLIAMVVQTQSAKLGIATGKNLAEACRDTFSRRTSLGLWIQAEIVAAACDVAEVVGAALGLNLLFGIPLFPAGLLAGAGAFVILALQQKGFRRLEAVIVAMVGV